MSRVFVMQATKYQADVSPASSYGTIRFVLTPGDRTSSTPELTLPKLFAALEDFDPDTDFILWSGGDPLSSILTGVVLAELGITKFKFLRYEKDRRSVGGPDRGAGFYVPVEVDFTDKE